MRAGPVLLLWVCYAVAVTGTTPQATTSSCTKTSANVYNVTGLAVDCSRRNVSAVPTNISSVAVVLDLAYNRLRFVNRESFKGLAQLKVLSLSYNQISTIEQGSFSELPELSELYLDHNGISSIASDLFKWPSRIENLDLSFNCIAHIGYSAFDDLGVTLKQLALGNNYLGRLFSIENSYKIFQELTNLTHLDLSNNGIYGFRSDVFRSQSNIRYLNLSGNALRDSGLFIEVHNHSGSDEYVQQASVFDSLSNLNFLDISHNSVRLCCEAYRVLANLEGLDLRSNAIPNVEPENITTVLPNLNELYLRGNPFDCSCRAATFFRWAADSFVDTDFANWTCQQPPSVAEVKVAKLDIHGPCGHDIKDDTLSIKIPSILISFISVIGAVLVAMFVIYRRRRRRAKFLGFENIELEERKYDVFVCYSSHDMAWVHQSLVPHLDSLNVHACIADRDFMPGTPILDNIIHSIEQSRQVVIVVTRNFLRSDWCRIELHMAEQKYFSSSEKYVIPILLEEIPVQMMSKSLRYLLATKTYLEWKDGRRQEDLFWRRLGAAVKSSLPVKRTNNDAMNKEDEVTITSLAQSSSPIKFRLSEDTDNEVDVEPDTQYDHETSASVSLNVLPKQQTTDHDHTTDTTSVDEGSFIDGCPPSDCQTVCSSKDHVDNPVVEDVKLTKTKRQALATFFTGMFEKGRHVFLTTLFRFKYTKTSFSHQKVSRSTSATELFLPKVLQESYIEEQAHVTCCHEEPIYQNSWFLYHAIRTRRKEPLPPTPDEQADDSISESQTTVIHMAAIEHSQSPPPMEIAYHDRGLTLYQEHVEEGLQVMQQPRLNVVTSSLATGSFDSKGGHLTIGGTGVRLFIPPGAIKDSTEQQITIAISAEECDKPTLTERQARISSVIKCSPHGITFEKSVVLSFPHTGEVSKGKTIHPLITNTGRGQQAVYEDMKEDHGAHAIVRKADCVVFLDHFTGVTLVEESPCPDEGAKGESDNNDSAEKPVYAIPFWTLTSSGDVVVRVRLCQKRDDAKQIAYEEERACGSRPCDGPPVTLYVPVRGGTKARVQVVMDNIRQGWASVDGLEKVTDCRRIFTDDEVQQCSFLLERNSDGVHNSNRFRCRLHIIPVGNEGDAQTIYVSVLTDEPPPPQKQDFTATAKRPPCLPAWAREELCRLLDPSNPKGNDWRMLSCELHLQLDFNDIQLFQEHSDKRSPTFQILSLFELDYGHLPQVQQLHALRKVLSEQPMGRPDASQLVEKVISQHFVDTAAPPTTEHHQQQPCNPVTPNTMARLTEGRYYSPYAAPCAVHPNVHSTITQLTNLDSSIPCIQHGTANCDNVPEEAAMLKQQGAVRKQTYRQDSNITSTAASFKVPTGKNSRMYTGNFENINQVGGTQSHVDDSASNKTQVAKCDDDQMVVEEIRIRRQNAVELPSSEDELNWTDDKKLTGKNDAVDNDLVEEGLAKSMTSMHLSTVEESVSLLNETDA